jgi:hypothetical protein
MKKFLAVLLMTLVLGAGAPAVFADGPQETPGHGTGRVETPGETDGPTDGPQETPGQVVLEVLISLATSLVA